MYDASTITYQNTKKGPAFKCKRCGRQSAPFTTATLRTKAARAHSCPAEKLTVTNTGPSFTIPTTGMPMATLERLLKAQGAHVEEISGNVSEGRTSSKVAHLAAAIQKTTDPFSTGDVIRWQDTRVLMGGRSRAYSVAALKAGGSWWLTGTGTLYSGNRVSYEELAKILALETVSSVQVSETWAPIS